MDSDLALRLMTDMLLSAAKMSAPILLATLVVGLVISIVQVATQIQEMTLTFVPKLIVVIAVCLGLGSWMLSVAVEQGGNCPLSEVGKVVTKYGVKLVGHTNVPSRIAVDATALYARNLVNYLQPLIDKETKAVKLDLADEVVKGSLLTQHGKVIHPNFVSARRGL